MGRVKHNTTERGNQKKRARLHDSYMQEKHPAIWSWMRAVEYHQEWIVRRSSRLRWALSPTMSIISWRRSLYRIVKINDSRWYIERLVALKPKWKAIWAILTGRLS